MRRSLADGVLPVADSEELDDADRHTEDVMLRLRLRHGLPLSVLTDAEAARADVAVARRAGASAAPTGWC